MTRKQPVIFVFDIVCLHRVIVSTRAHTMVDKLLTIKYLLIRQSVKRVKHTSYEHVVTK